MRPLNWRKSIIQRLKIAAAGAVLLGIIYGSLNPILQVFNKPPDKEAASVVVQKTGFEYIPAPEEEVVGAGEENLFRRTAVIDEYTIPGSIQRRAIMSGSGAQRNYLDGSGQWQPLQDSLADNGQNHFVADKLPFRVMFPKVSTGTGLFDVTSRYDLVTNQEIADPNLPGVFSMVDVATVNGQLENYGGGVNNAVRYPNAYPDWNADIILVVSLEKIPKLKYLIQFTSEPDVDTDIRIPHVFVFNRDIALKYGNTTLPEGNSVTTDEPVSITASAKRGVGIDRPEIWDSAEEQHRQLVELDITNAADNEVPFEKIIPRAFLQDDDTVYPVTTDATFSGSPQPAVATTAGDGYFQRDSGEAWASAQTASASDSVDNSATTLGVRTQFFSASTQYAIYRAGVCFPTQTLGAGAIVTHATTSLWAASKDDEDNDAQAYINLVSFSPASKATFVTTDYNDMGTTEFSTDKDITGITTGAYLEFVGDADMVAAISVTTATCMGVREGHDIENSAVGVATDAVNRVNFSSADTSGTSQDPLLELTYTPAPAAANNRNRVRILDALFRPALFQIAALVPRREAS